MRGKLYTNKFLGEQFDRLDVNNDTAVNETELARFFTKWGDQYTQKIQEVFAAIIKANKLPAGTHHLNEA